MARFVFYAIVFFLLYKLVFDFIIPIFMTTTKMRNQFNQARQQMQEEQQQTNQQQGETGKNSSPGNAAKIGEYIEFEEIRK